MEGKNKPIPLKKREKWQIHIYLISEVNGGNKSHKDENHSKANYFRPVHHTLDCPVQSGWSAEAPKGALLTGKHSPVQLRAVINSLGSL